MKKIVLALCVVLLLFSIAGCSREVLPVEIQVPAKAEKDLFYADEVLIAQGREISITPRAGFNAVELVLFTEDGTMMQTVTLTQDEGTDFLTEKDTRYRLAVRAENIYDEPVRILLDVEHADLCIG